LIDHAAKALQRFGRAIDLHAHDRPVPAREQKLSQILGIKTRRNFAARAGVAHCSGKRLFPLRKDLDQPRSQQLAASRRLNAEIAQKTT
jgi:hypothetical protein